MQNKTENGKRSLVAEHKQKHKRKKWRKKLFFIFFELNANGKGESEMKKLKRFSRKWRRKNVRLRANQHKIRKQIDYKTKLGDIFNYFKLLAH